MSRCAEVLRWTGLTFLHSSLIMCNTMKSFIKPLWMIHHIKITKTKRSRSIFHPPYPVVFVPKRSQTLTVAVLGSRKVLANYILCGTSSSDQEYLPEMYMIYRISGRYFLTMFEWFKQLNIICGSAVISIQDNTVPTFSSSSVCHRQ